MKRITFYALCVAVLAAVACGGNSGKKAKTSESDEPQAGEVTEQVQAKAEKPVAKKAPEKKWYQQDFVLTEVMYVASASVTRTYARKGNIVIGTSEGSGMTNLFVCSDSTRTQYLIGNEKKTYAKRGEKTGFDNVDDAIYKYLKSQMSETVFGKTLKKGEEGTTVRDTTLFGRPAYVMTKETTEKNIAAEVWGKSIMYIDKELGLPYYKWGIIKNNGQVLSEGKVFEVTFFSTEPTYEGLIMSLDGLTGIN